MTRIILPVGSSYADIPQYTQHAGWRCDVGLQHLVDKWLPEQLAQGLNLEPDFQRAHVWNEDQQIRFVEHLLRGGLTGLDLYFNHPGWHGSPKTAYNEYVIVDGKQRLQAILRFLRDEIAVFGHLRSELKGTPRYHLFRVRWCVNNLQSRCEVLQWYLEFNGGGTPHTEEELDRVRALLYAEEISSSARSIDVVSADAFDPILVSAEAFDEIQHSIENPPPPAPALTEAFKRGSRKPKK